MAQQHVLAIDLGTGGPKAALVTTDGIITAHEFEATELLLLPGGGAEQDPERMVDAPSPRRCDACWPAATSRPRTSSAVSVTAQWSGTVAVDADGRHL